MERWEREAQIGRLMGESPSIHWRVADVRRAYAIEFYYGDGRSSHPEREAREWIDGMEKRHPGYMARNGYSLRRVEVWPHYLANGEACVRFMNWALSTSKLAGNVVLYHRPQFGMVVAFDGGDARIGETLGSDGNFAEALATALANPRFEVLLAQKIAAGRGSEPIDDEAPKGAMRSR